MGAPKPGSDAQTESPNPTVNYGQQFDEPQLPTVFECYLASLITMYILALSEHCKSDIGVLNRIQD